MAVDECFDRTSLPVRIHVRTENVSLAVRPDDAGLVDGDPSTVPETRRVRTNATIVEAERDVSCQTVGLLPGTLIQTNTGEQPIESLKVGDFVETLDSGFQPIRFILRQSVDLESRDSDGAGRPVCIEQGALGFGLPRRDVWASPHHRMLYASLRVPLFFGEDAVLVQAEALVGSCENVRIDRSQSHATYLHLLFDRDEIIYAEGAATEAYWPEQETAQNLGCDVRAVHDRFGNSNGDWNEGAGYLTLRNWELMAAIG